MLYAGWLEIQQGSQYLDVITDLEKKRLIKTRKDKPNSQIYRIFTSSETVVGESLNNLHEMKEALLNLLTTIQQNHIKVRQQEKKSLKKVTSGLIEICL